MGFVKNLLKKKPYRQNHRTALKNKGNPGQPATILGTEAPVKNRQRMLYIS
jgi:hypothetical protein